MFDQVFAIEGRLGKDPELRFSPSGTAVGSFSMAFTERKNVDGQWQDGDTTWFRVVCFRQLAENCADSLSKGDLAIVVGKLKMEEWEKDGEKHTTATILADSVGPSLKFRRTPHGEGRVERRTTRDESDPWASGGGGQSSSEDPPF